MHAFSICTCSAQLSMFHMEKRSRNTLIIIILSLTASTSGGPFEAFFIHVIGELCP